MKNNFQLNKNFRIIFSLTTAVSYTHLDVYKRQGVYCQSGEETTKYKKRNFDVHT